jgi:hypothetical protein
VYHKFSTGLISRIDKELSMIRKQPSVFKWSKSFHQRKPGMVAHIYNSSYLEVGDGEDQGSRSMQAKSYQDPPPPISTKQTGCSGAHL